MKCPKCQGLKFVPVLTFGYVCAGYLSLVRCVECGEIINVEEKTP